MAQVYFQSLFSLDSDTVLVTFKAPSYVSPAIKVIKIGIRINQRQLSMDTSTFWNTITKTTKDLVFFYLFYWII